MGKWIVERNERRDFQINRWRQDVGRLARRAGRRRLPECLDQSYEFRRDSARKRSGRDRDRERRTDLELVVQSVDRAALSRRRGQRVSVSALQRATGKRF